MCRHRTGQSWRLFDLCNSQWGSQKYVTEVRRVRLVCEKADHGGETGWGAMRNGEEAVILRHFGNRTEATCELIGWSHKGHMMRD